jgi:hypothetical protein
MPARSWTTQAQAPGPGQVGLELTFEGCDFNYVFAMRLWSFPGVVNAPFFAGGAARGYAGSFSPIAAWLNPHSTTGFAVEVSKHFNIQPWGQQRWIASNVRSWLTLEGARAVQGPN